jgi:carbonic anhydrase/acetyltransferase-like protein (isoleucine patch superfamily)
MPHIIPHHGKTPIVPRTAYLAPTATLIGDVVLGEHASLWFNVVVRGDVNYVRIGDRTNIQDNSTVHVHVDDRPTVIGDDVLGGHNILVHGCTVGDRVLIGMGAAILDGVVIGEESIVAAGSLITPDTEFPPRSMIVGRPARRVRAVTDREVEDIILFGVRNYLQVKETYASSSDGNG